MRQAEVAYVPAPIPGAASPDRDSTLIKRTVAIALAFAFTCAWASAASAADDAGKPAYFKLSNGLEVVVVEDHRSPVVTQMVWYKVGGADEPRGKTGFAAKQVVALARERGLA